MDGIPGHDGGLQQVKDGILAGTYIYPTHGEEIIQLALDILDKKPFKKNSFIKSFVVTPQNVDDIIMSSDQLLKQNDYLVTIQKKLDNYLGLYHLQRNILYIAVVAIFLLLIALIIIWKAVKAIKRSNRKYREMSEKMKQLNDEQMETARGLLSFYTGRGICFAYFQRFPVELVSGLGIQDKVFCEAVANPANTVKLFYRYKHENHPFTEETMRDVFEGIRVREFVLFEGEELECYTVETGQDGKSSVSPHRYLKAGMVPENLKDSRYGRITAMSQLLTAGDKTGFSEALKEYRQLDSLTKEIFTLM